MFKKFFSTLICVSMLAMLLPMSAFAGTTAISVTGWESSFITWTAEEQLQTSTVSVITDEDIVPSGKGCVKIGITEGVGNGLHANAAQVVAVESGKTYRLTGKFNVPAATWRCSLKFGDTAFATSESGGVLNPAVGKWADIDYTFTYTYNNPQFRITSNWPNSGAIYADDLSLKEVIYAEDGETVTGYGEELLTNGDFEADFAAPEDPYFAQVAPANAKNHIAVKSNLSNIAIYQVANGVETKLDLGNPVLDRTDFKLKVFEHANLTNDTEYTYVIKNVTATGVESAGITVSGTPKAAYSGYVAKDNWSFKSYGNAYGTFDILNGIGRNQSAGMKLTNMNFTWNNSSYVYATGSEKINLDTTKTYKLTYWVKSSANNQSVSDNVQFKLTGSALSADGVTYGNSGAAVYEAIPAVDGWAQRTLYCKPSSEANQIEIKVARHIEEMIFDDFQIYEVDANLAVVDGAKNLCADGNFNFEAAYKAPDAPYFVQVAPANAKNHIAVKANLSDIAIYQVADGVETKLDLGNPVLDRTDFKLKVFEHANLTNDTEYTYVVKNVSATGIESEGITVSGTPKAAYDQFQTKDAWIYKSYGNSYGTVDVIDGIGRNQSAALKLTNMNFTWNNNCYVYATSADTINLDTTKTYKLTYWVKSSKNNQTVNDNLQFKLTGSALSVDGITYQNAGATIYEAIPAKDEWMQRTIYCKPTNAANKIEMKLARHVEEMIFDDFEIYEVDANLAVVDGAKNLCADGNFDFEAAYQPPAEAELIVVAPRVEANYISVKTTAPAIEIYQVANGVETKLDLGEALLSVPDFNTKIYLHSGLTNETEYTYRIKTVNDKNIASEGKVVSGTPSSAYADYIKKDSWSYKSFGHNGGTFEIKDGIGRDGSKAAYITNMANSSSNNTYQLISNTSGLTLETDKTYRLTFWAKAGVHNTRADAMGVRLTGSRASADGTTYTADAGKDCSPLSVASDGTWSQQTCYFQPASASNALEIRMYRHFEELILDEFELYEVDENLAVVDGAKNLMAAGNYDFDLDAEVIPLSATFKFYPADSEGEIIDDYGISALSDLADVYETNHLYAEATIQNPEFASGKAFRMYVAVYKNKALYDVRSISATAAYRPGALIGEKFGQAYTMPDMTDGEYEVKVFLWDATTVTTPIVDNIGAIGEF